MSPCSKCQPATFFSQIKMGSIWVSLIVEPVPNWCWSTISYISNTITFLMTGRKKITTFTQYCSKVQVWSSATFLEYFVAFFFLNFPPMSNPSCLLAILPPFLFSLSADLIYCTYICTVTLNLGHINHTEIQNRGRPEDSYIQTNKQYAIINLQSQNTSKKPQSLNKVTGQQMNMLCVSQDRVAQTYSFLAHSASCRASPAHQSSESRGKTRKQRVDGSQVSLSFFYLKEKMKTK